MAEPDYVQLAIDAGQLVEADEVLDDDLDSLTYECYVTTYKRPNYCKCGRPKPSQEYTGGEV